MGRVIRLLTSLEAVAACREQWNALAAGLGVAAVFHENDATLLNLGVGSATHRARPHVLTVYEDDAMIAAAPMTWASGRIGMGVLRWADSGTPLYTGLLCRTDREDEVFPMLSAALFARSGLRKLKVDHVPDGSALARFCAFLGGTPGNPVPAPHVNLTVGPVWDRLSAKRRKALQNYRRKLERMGPVAFDVHGDPDEVAELVAWIFRAKRSKLAGQEAADWIQKPQVESYFQTLARRQAARECAFVHRMRVGDRTAAASLIFRHDDTAYYSKIGYDPAFAAGSPGWHEMLDLSHHLRAEGVRVLDLMIGSGFVKDSVATGAGSVRNWRLPVNPLKTLLRNSQG